MDMHYIKISPNMSDSMVSGTECAISIVLYINFLIPRLKRSSNSNPTVLIKEKEAGNSDILDEVCIWCNSRLRSYRSLTDHVHGVSCVSCRHFVENLEICWLPCGSMWQSFARRDKGRETARFQLNNDEWGGESSNFRSRSFVIRAAICGRYPRCGTGLRSLNWTSYKVFGYWDHLWSRRW